MSKGTLALGKEGLGQMTGQKVLAGTGSVIIIIIIMYVGSRSSRESRMGLETLCDQLKSQVVMPRL